jgi:flagellar hook-associated protein 2
MSGISTGTGVFSGIDSKSLIDQILAVEGRSRVLVQRRVVQLQQQNAAYLDINSRLSSIKTAASAFRLENLFKTKAATSSNEDVLTATASNSAAAGTYSVRVERLVSAQQFLSRGFADRNSSGVGMTSITVESAKARLDNDVALADFNDGQGIARGRIVVTAGANTATVDLSRATTVNDVLNALNGTGTLNITATAEGGRLVIKDNAGGTVTVASANGGTTAESLGIAGTGTGTLNGSTVYGLNRNTSLSSLNDGNGVTTRLNTANTAFASFVINVGGTAVNVNISDVYTNDTTQTPPKITKTAAAPTTVGGVLDRMNAALSAAGFADVQARVNTSENRIEIVDTTGARTVTVGEAAGAFASNTARDLGLLSASGTTATGSRVLAGMNSILTNSLAGGLGMQGDGVLNIRLRDGANFSLTLPAGGDFSATMRAIEAASGTLPNGQPKLKVSLNQRGTGIQVTDQSGGTGNLIIRGTTDSDPTDSVVENTAQWLGIETDVAGVASNTVSGSNLQKQYLSEATAVSSLNGGAGIGTGRFRITDSLGQIATIDIGDDTKTIGELIREINAATTVGTGGTGGTALLVKARINANGDGIELYDTGTGSARIKVEDTTGTVARSLGVAGTSTGTGVGDANRLNGSQERTITFAVGDTLDQVVTKINEAGVGVQAAIMRDGIGSTPFRLSLTARDTGSAGRMIVDAGAFNLGLTQLEAGQDALAFVGGGDIANAIVATSSTNTLDGVIPGVKVDLKAVTGATPVSLSIASDTDRMLEGVNAFISAFNDAAARIDRLTDYDEENETRGPLLGDGVVNEVRSTLFRLVGQRAQNVSGRYQRLTDVGITVAAGGKELKFDEEKFRNAMATDPEAVERLFANRTQINNGPRQITTGITVNETGPATFSSLGVMGQFEQAIDRYIGTVSGTLTSRSRGLDSQIAIQNRRIEALTSRLDTRRGILERQFQAMETTIGRLQTQQSSLGTIAAAAGRR